MISTVFFPHSFYLFSYFWLCWVFVATWPLLQLQRVGASLSLQCSDSSLQQLLLLWSLGFRVCGLSRHGPSPWSSGLVAPWPVGSSWIRDQTYVSCIGRQILYHWASRGSPGLGSFEDYWPVFCRMPPCWYLFDAFLRIILRLWFGEEDRPGKRLLLASECLSRWLTTWCWPWSPGLCSVCRFLHCKVTIKEKNALFPSFSVLYSLKGGCYVEPALNDLGVTFCLLKGRVST